MKKISFVIPCYNSEKTIESVVNEIKNIVKDDYEIILVNDHSTDNVWDVIKKLSSENSNIEGISFSKNFGQHAALMAGYKIATGDVIVSLDDDGQTPADEVYSLIDELEKGYDVVYASYDNKKHSGFRNFGSKVNDKMCEKLVNKPKKITLSSFFVARKFVIDEVTKYENSFAFVPGLVLRTTQNISMVPVKHRSRKEGKSGYSFKKLLSLWLNGFTTFSVKPLRISSMIGCIASLVGFIFAIYVIIHKITTPETPMGWSSLAAIVLILGGIILFVLGMIGEYLGRAYISINNAPQYVIKESTKENK